MNEERTFYGKTSVVGRAVLGARVDLLKWTVEELYLDLVARDASTRIAALQPDDTVELAVMLTVRSARPDDA